MRMYRTLRLAAVVLLAALLPGLTSCKKEATDVSDLVSTIPSSASIVMGLNITSVLEKAGCKVDGHNITPGQVVTEWIDKKGSGNSGASALKMFVNGESGIDPSGAVYFMDAYNSYITALIADTGKFTAFVEQQTGGKFQNADGNVKTCENISMCGAQMWVCISSGNSIDARAIKNYSELEKGSSFASNEGVAAEIVTMESDIVGWGNINALLKSYFSTGDLLQYTMIVNTLYEEPSSLSFKVDFGKGKLKGSAIVLNSQAEKAKFLLPVDKIDVSTVESVATDAQAIFALSITKKLTEKVENLSKSLGGNMFGSIVNALKTVDGTVAVAIGDLHSPDSNVSGVITTDGKDNQSLMNFLTTLGNTSKDGKLIRFSRGTVSGSLNVKESAAMLKGSSFGCVLNSADPEMLGSDVVKTVVATLSPDGNGIRFDLTLISTDEKENILLTFLKS